MLFKLLSDYRPRGVAVAWDTRPVHRKEIDAEYKAERRPMPDLLREQFPHFRPIVEAFGYQNLEFEGWEADDVIATLATLADEAGIKTCVVSTDRDAFQLVSENVCLMMTPRGVADVQVYTPERVEARYGIRPRPDPGLHRPEGRHERQHPRHPGHRRQDGRPADRAVRLARGRRRACCGALARAIEGDRRERRAGRAPRSSWRRCGAISTSASIPPSSSLQPPDRSELKEIFRRFEFRGAARARRHARRGAACGGASRDRVGDRVLARRRPRGGSAAASASPPTRSASPSRPGRAR